MEKLCIKCGVVKDTNEFAKNKKRHDGLQTYCTVCKKIFDTAYYAKHKRKVLDRNFVDKQKKLEWLNEYKKSLTCIKCGESHPATLEFHHRDSDSKVNNIANLVRQWSIARLKTEIAKCDVLCANCHRKLHYKEKHGTIA